MRRNDESPARHTDVALIEPSPADRASHHGSAAYVAELAALAAASGISHTGVAPAAVLGRARAELLRRRDLGLADAMQFTYRNPERSTDPGAAVVGAQAVFVGARSYWTPAPAAPAAPAGRIARYAWADHYAELRTGLWAVAHRLRRDGYKAVAYADDNSIVDREVAYLGGIGWFGKNANLLLPGAGSWFVLGCVVTTAPLPVAAAPLDDGCGGCRRCIDHCPTGAIVEPGVIDARRCLAWVLQKPGIIPRELRDAVGDRLYGCDDCQDACPPAVRFGPRRPAPVPFPDTSNARAWLPVLDLVAGSDDEVMAAWGRWYVADREPRWIRRNALVVLGNIGDPADLRVARVLAQAVTDADPILRVHAVWAARRLGLDHLVPEHDDDGDVAEELAVGRVTR